MIHTEKEEAEYIYEINSETLFQQVKQLHIPFHRWYQWLETKFAHMKQVHDEEQLKQQQSPAKRSPLSKEEEQEYVNVNTPSNADMTGG